MSRVVLNMSSDEGREATVLCRRASSVDAVATSVVGHLFRGCVRTGAVRQAACFVERGMMQAGRVWSRSMPCKQAEDCERRVRTSEAAKPGLGRATRRGGRGPSAPPRERHAPAEAASRPASGEEWKRTIGPTLSKKNRDD
jgi:hypothetical protein